MNFSKYFGDKKFFKMALLVALPIMLQNLISSAVQLVDNLMVGALGDSAMGAVGASNRVFFVVQVTMFGITGAGSIFIAQYFGAKQAEKMKETFRVMIISMAIFSTIFCAVMSLFPMQILNFFTDSEITATLGAQYITIIAFAVFPMLISFAISSSMRAIGEVKIPLYINTAMVGLNALLNYVLIFGIGVPALGVRGAALATLITRIVEASLFLIVMKKGDMPFKTKITELFHLTKSLSTKILSKAAPLVANEMLWSLGMATLYMLYAKGGTNVMAGYTAASTVADLFFVAFAGMATATTILVSQPLGANDLEKAKDNGYKMIGTSAILAFLISLVMFLFSGIVPIIYTELSVEAIGFAEQMLRIQAVMFMFYMISAQNYFILRAGGDVISTFIFDSGFMWVINIPIVYFLVMYTTMPIVWIYFFGQATEFIKIAIGRYFLKKEKWVHSLAHEEEIIL